MTQSIDLNQAACIQHASHIGFYRYVNVCSGVVHDVTWGAVDWLGAVGGMLLVLILFFVLIVFLCFMIYILVEEIL